MIQKQNITKQMDWIKDFLIRILQLNRGVSGPTTVVSQKVFAKGQLSVLVISIL